MNINKHLIAFTKYSHPTEWRAKMSTNSTIKQSNMFSFYLNIPTCPIIPHRGGFPLLPVPGPSSNPGTKHLIGTESKTKFIMHSRVHKHCSCVSCVFDSDESVCSSSSSSSSYVPTSFSSVYNDDV